MSSSYLRSILFARACSNTFSYGLQCDLHAHGGRSGFGSLTRKLGYRGVGDSVYGLRRSTRTILAY